MAPCNEDEQQLQHQIEETLDYMSFACNPETTVSGSMGFSLHSQSGKDYSFVLYIEDTEGGKKAYGRFEDPDHADILATIPAEDFIKIYNGEMSVSGITRMVLRGKFSIRNYDLNGVNKFMGAFDFSSQKWQAYYAHCDLIKEHKQREENRFFRKVKPIRLGPVNPLFRSLSENPVFANLFCEVHSIPSLSEFLKTGFVTKLDVDRVPTVYSSRSLPSLGEVQGEEEESASVQCEPSQTVVLDQPTQSTQSTQPDQPDQPDQSTQSLLPSRTNDISLLDMESTPSWLSTFHNPPLHRILLNSLVDTINNMKQLSEAEERTIGERDPELCSIIDERIEQSYCSLLQRALPQRLMSDLPQNVFEDSDVSIFNDEAPLPIFNGFDEHLNEEPPLELIWKVFKWPFRKHVHSYEKSNEESVIKKS